jgi:hypothetical protein
MKKKLIYSSALAALLSASSIALAGGPEIIPIEDYFSGFYVGGTGSVHHVNFNSSSSVALTQAFPPGAITPIFNPQTILSSDTDGASVDGYGGIQGGFGWTFNHVWYLGVQGFGEFGSESSTQNSNSTPVNTNIFNVFTDTATISTSTTTKIGNDYGIVAKLGYVVAPTTLIYGKVGGVWADVTVSDTATASNNFNIKNPFTNVVVFNANTTATGGSSTEDSGKSGFIAGIGAEHFVYQDLVSLNIEWDYMNFGTVSTGPATLFATQTVNGNVNQNINGRPTSLTTSASTDTSVDTFLAGINFYFGRNWF